jgi:hypothetical protein
MGGSRGAGLAECIEQHEVVDEEEAYAAKLIDAQIGGRQPGDRI